jgi:AcrR family transcriptional regulator
MLYYHFGSKRALYVEVLRDMLRAVGARVRAIADGPGTAAEKIRTFVATIIEEAAARPWFPPIMLRELAARAPHFDAATFHMMNDVLAGVTDVITQGKREGTFRDVDPLLAHLSIMPPVLIFFARQRVLAGRKLRGGLAEPRQLDQFVRHMQASARGMLRKTS